MSAMQSQLVRRCPPIVVHCACCGTRLAGNAEYCGQCETPASLSHAVSKRGQPQSFVSVLGASNSGKTVYLGMLLDILSKGPESFRGTSTSAFSIDLQQQVVSALERRTFPEKTPCEADAWKWMHCQVALNENESSKEVDLISPDFAGEAIAMEMNQSGIYPAIQHVVRKSDGLMILCDSLRVRDEGSSEDLFALKLLAYVAQLHAMTSDQREKHRRASGPSIAIVFTKCDGCPEAVEDPHGFAASHMSRLFDYCSRTFVRHQYFAASVAGSSGTVIDHGGIETRVPFHVQPRGVLEPLQWIVRSMDH